jgi:hypothetical protein
MGETHYVQVGGNNLLLILWLRDAIRLQRNKDQEICKNKVWKNEILPTYIFNWMYGCLSTASLPT